MKNKNIAIIAIAIIIILAISVAVAENGNDKDDKLYQVSILQSFMHGAYDGVISIDDLKSKGDTGLGTFNGVDGEMIILDGVVYQAKTDGSINIITNETTPFSTITYFDEDEKMNLKPAKSFEGLTNQLDKEIKKLGKNNIYVAKIQGNFSNINVRSIEKQTKPYKEFTEVAAVDQAVFNYTNQSGTIIAVYFPEYMGELNMHGWHLHFLNDAKDKGGHVLNLTMNNGTCGIDEINEFELILPSTSSFKNMDLSENMTNKIHSVE